MESESVLSGSEDESGTHAGPTGVSVTPPGPATPPLPRFGALAWLVAGGIFVTAAGGAGYALYLSRHNAHRTVPGLTLAGEPVGGIEFAELPSRVHAISERFLSRKARLLFGRDRKSVAWRDMGVYVDEPRLVAELQAIGHSGDPVSDLDTYWKGRRRGFARPVPAALDDKRALEFLMELKDEVDRGAVDARLDLEKHTVAPEKPGYLLRVYDALVSLSYGVRALSQGHGQGAEAPESELHLAVAEIAPQITAADLKDIDVSTVLASWETRYSNAAIDSDRTYNLKVGADKLNGHILKPGEVFSFNGSVGDRTEKEGYRVAPVIQGGELIDGLAGGMCQIASTLHAAAFFAGLDIVRSTPHSRPSSYIPMGLDSTVVWPSVDLKLKNPYDFPIVIHYMVNQGSVKVELLGKKMPVRVAYEREIVAETPFPSQARPDLEMPVGQKFHDQEGYPGYRIKRRRYIFTGKWKMDPKDPNKPKPEVLVSRREWDVYYPPTTEIVRTGTGAPTVKKKDPPPSHHIPAVPARDKPFFRIIK